LHVERRMNASCFLHPVARSDPACTTAFTVAVSHLYCSPVGSQGVCRLLKRRQLLHPSPAEAQEPTQSWLLCWGAATGYTRWLKPVCVAVRSCRSWRNCSFALAQKASMLHWQRVLISQPSLGSLGHKRSHSTMEYHLQAQDTVICQSLCDVCCSGNLWC
jgi:hypothetical protein